MRVTFLFPRHMRMGQPVLTGVKKDDHGYWLVTYHCLSFDHRLGQQIPKAINGTGRAYNCTSSVRITQELYDAFVAEANLNREQYLAETPERREEREAELAQMVEQYKQEHGL